MHSEMSEYGEHECQRCYSSCNARFPRVRLSACWWKLSKSSSLDGSELVQSRPFTNSIQTLAECHGTTAKLNREILMVAALVCVCVCDVEYLRFECAYRERRVHAWKLIWIRKWKGPVQFLVAAPAICGIRGILLTKMLPSICSN